MTTHIEKDVERACALLEAKEYTEHWAETGLGKRLEAALTALHNDAAIQREIIRDVAEEFAQAVLDHATTMPPGGVPRDPPDVEAFIDRAMAERGAA